MRSLLAMALLLAAPWAYGDEAAPNLGDALSAGDAAMAPKTPTAAADIDPREAALRDLEYRIEKMQTSRRMMPLALAGLADNPKITPEMREISCKAAVPVMRAPDFFKLVRGKVKALEKRKTFEQLTPGQIDRLNRAKATITEMEAEPDLDCTKY